MQALTFVCATLILLSTGSASPDGDYDFELLSTTGETVRFECSAISTGVVICFVGNECPLARLYAGRLSEMAAKFGPRGIRFFGINSNQQDSMEELKAFGTNLNVKFPLLKDYDNEVADRFEAKRTPEVFLLNESGKVVYRGAIDDQYQPGVVRDQAKHHFLTDAITQLLNGKPVQKSATKPEGCLIGRVKHPTDNPTVTYTNQISRIFQNHCLECHRSKQIGPFSLEDYDEAKGWAEMIVEVVENGRMPPWHATSEHLEFTNARRLDPADKKLLRDWLNQGTPYGSTSDLPAKKSFVAEWQLPKNPDLVIAMGERPFAVPANGAVEYQYFVVDPQFKEDKWIVAASVQPGNPSVLHHSIVFVRPPDGKPFEGIGWLTAFVPGTASPKFNPRYARFVPAGSKLVFQQHYTPNGSAATDLTKVGLVFGDEDQITHKVYTVAALNQEFEIPAESSGHVVESELPYIPRDAQLLSFAPHMHYRGKSFQSFAKTESGTTQLIDVPAYDFNWQHNYELRNELDLSQIEAVSCRFTFDNSVSNPFNPDPKRRVFWGDQTWEEMAVAFFHVAKPKSGENLDVANRPPDDGPDNEEAAREFVEQYFRKFDRNQDGVLIRDETPHAIQHFRFYTYDSNHDGSLSREELLTVARERFK